MWLRFFVGVILCLIFHAPWVGAEQFRVGPVYTDQPGDVSAVIELPPGVTPEASAFRLLVDGKPVATARDIKPFRLSGQGVAFIVCVDVSGTMKREPLDDTKEALLSLLGRLRPEDRFALISFADEDKIESSFEQTRAHHAEAVGNLQSRGRLTRLYQTLYKSLDRWPDAQLPKRRRIIVISDGKDEGSPQSSENIIAKSNALGIPIDTVGRGKIEAQYVEALRGVANATGGRFVHARPDRLALTDALDRIYRDLLETRSLVGYFMYPKDKAGRMTQNAVIELQQPGALPWRASILEAIPQKEPAVVWPLWLLLVVIVGVGLVALARLRTDREAKSTTQPEPVTPESQTPLVMPFVPTPELDHEPEPEPKPELRGGTQVGGYYFPAPGRGQPTAILVGVSDPVEGQQFFVDKELFSIGASPENDLYIVDDDYVSGDHAYLRYDAGRLLLFDRGSRNGTFVNAEQVTDTGFALEVGDRIRVGTSTFEVVIGPR